MVVLDIYSKCLKDIYKTTLCSKATLFVCVCTIVNIIFPFVFAYRSRGFWLKHDTFYEQPDVRFQAEYLFYAATNNVSNPVFCSNFPNLQRHTCFDACNRIKIREIDYNLDGRVDEFYFNLNLDLPKFTKLLSINLLVTLDYRLHTVCPLHLHTATILQLDLNSYISEVDIFSELQLSQSSPLDCQEKVNYINYPLLPSTRDYFRFEHVLENYLARNITTHLTNVYKVTKTGPKENFNVNIRIKYPVHEIYYRTGFWQILKWAWVQYFALYIVLKYFMDKIKRYIFENRLVLYYKDCFLKKNV